MKTIVSLTVLVGLTGCATRTTDSNEVGIRVNKLAGTHSNVKRRVLTSIPVIFITRYFD